MCIDPNLTYRFQQESAMLSRHYSRGWTLVAICFLAVASGIVAQEVAKPAAEDPGTDRFFSANALYNRKLYVVAVKEYDDFLKQFPDHNKAEQARYGLALSLYTLGRFKDAEPILVGLIERAKVGDPMHLSLLLGQCRIRAGKFAEAEEAFEVVVSGTSGKHKPAALAGLTETMFAQGKWEQTVARAGNLKKLDPHGPFTARALYQQAYAHQQLRQYEPAVETLDELSRTATNEVAFAGQVVFLLGECYREMGRFDDAATCYAEAAKTAGGAAAPELQYRLGVVLIERGKYDEAVQALNKALQMKPGAVLAEKIVLQIGRAQVERRDFLPGIQTLSPLAKRTERSTATAEAVLWLSRAYARQGKIDEAAKALNDAIPVYKDSPLLADFSFDLGNLQMQGKRYEDAARTFEDMTRAFPNWPQSNDLVRLYGVSLHHLKRYEESLGKAEEFLSRFPNDKQTGEVMFLKAENLFLMNRLADAAKSYSEVASSPAGGANAAPATFRLAMVHYKTNNFAKAVEIADPLTKRSYREELFDPLFFVLGDASFRLQRWDDAVRYLDTFAKQNRKGAANLDVAAIEMAVANMNRGETNAAADILRVFARQFPESPQRALAQSEMGRIYYEGGKLRESRDEMEALLKSFPQAPQCADALYYLGWIAKTEKKDDEAADRFDVLLKRFPKDRRCPDAALQKALCRLSQEKYPEAQAAAEELLRLFPNHPRLDIVSFSLGVALARQQLWQDAKRQFEEFLDRHPDSETADRALYELAWCERGMERKAEAVKRYDQLLTSHPGSELALKARAERSELTFDAKEFEQTVLELKRALETAKEPALREEMLYRLGAAQFNKGDFEDAARSLESFVTNFPGSKLAASAGFQAGECRLKLGDPRKARDHFSAAVSKAAPGRKEKTGDSRDKGSGKNKKVRNETVEKTGNGDDKVYEPALVRLAETHAALLEWEDSDRRYEELLKRFPKSAFARLAKFGRGWALENLRKYDDAIALFREVVALKERDPLSARCQLHIGECLFGQKKYDEALIELVRVQTTYRMPEWSAKALLEMARVFDAKGDAAKAEAQYREVMRDYPKEDAAKAARERLDALRKTK
jgi:TolA-binding protein